MANAPYSLTAVRKPKNYRRRIINFLIFLLILLLLSWLGFVIQKRLQPHTAIKQAAAINTPVAVAAPKYMHYDLDHFGVDLPSTWTQDPTPVNGHHSFAWSTDPDGTNSEMVEIYEDSIPLNFGLNRVQMVTAATDHLNLDGSVSDNCSMFTANQTPAPGTDTVPAKWLGLDFLCNQKITDRDIIGTSSSSGVNTVSLQDSTGTKHNYFFLYTNHQINPDYSVLQGIITSLKMQ